MSRSTALVLLVLGFLILLIDTSRAGAPEWPQCVTDGLTQGVIGRRTIDGQNYFVRRMATIFDAAIDDFGESAVGDSAEMFCVSRRSSDRFGKLAMCLTGERCPWRDPQPERGDQESR